MDNSVFWLTLLLNFIAVSADMSGLSAEIATLQYESFLDFSPKRECRSPRERRQALNKTCTLWKKGIVVYEFDKSFSFLERETIKYAWEPIEKNTCVTFLPKSYFKPEEVKNRYVLITNQHGDSCRGPLGGQCEEPTHPDIMNVGKFCLVRGRKGFIQRLILRLLGVDFTHLRPDRDNYIEVDWDNIEEQESYTDFAKRCDTHTFGVSYDYGSLMHPSNWYRTDGRRESLRAFTTISVGGQVRTENICLGQSLKITDCDLTLIFRMYGCEGGTPDYFCTENINNRKNDSCNHLIDPANYD